MARNPWLLLVAIAAFAAAPLPASAAAEAGSSYSKTQTYSAALRYLRVDLSYDVTEKDPDAAYLLFRFVPTGKKVPTNGSIEIVEREGAVHFFVRLPDLPRYHEQMLSDGLIKKLKTEYGDPPPREAPPPKDKDRDKDGDKDRDKDKDKARDDGDKDQDSNKPKKPENDTE